MIGAPIYKVWAWRAVPWPGPIVEDEEEIDLTRNNQSRLRPR